MKQKIEKCHVFLIHKCTCIKQILVVGKYCFQARSRLSSQIADVKTEIFLNLHTN